MSTPNFPKSVETSESGTTDYWPEMSFDIDRVFRQIQGKPDENPEVKQLRAEMNTFKKELKPWVKEETYARQEKLRLLCNFLRSFIVKTDDSNARLAVNELNPAFVKYAWTKGGIVIQPFEIKGLMYQLFELDPKEDELKPSNERFWYKGNNGCFYRTLRWATVEERA